MIEMIAADGKGVSVTTEHEHVEVGTSQRNATCEGQGAAVNEVRAVRLHEIREAARASDAGHGRDLLVIDFSLLDQFKVEREHREISAARAPRRMIRSNFLLGQAFAVCI